MDTSMIFIYFRCHALYVLRRVSPSFSPLQQLTLVILSNKNTINACLFSNPSQHAAREVPSPDSLARTPLWLKMMKAFPSVNGRWDPKQGDRNASGQLAPCPQVSICPPPLQGHHPMITLLLNQSEVIIQPMKDGDGKRIFELVPIVTMSCHPWDSNAKQTPRQPTPGLSGTQWSEDLFHGKKLPSPFLILTFASSEMTLPPFVKHSQHNGPPIPGLSQSSEPHEDT
ncbi:hypothetical protein O181_023848 [Austropuccinia psidii MF-1]|uniref:Uncharacterized protein n=1 Tax=Austropuccinia psidii MF-1 TaxID=1389203 RepID=A0A9Q3GXN5_9BASI|nr:hypothetical protein [Austropuccinia psidii MF-1]